MSRHLYSTGTLIVIKKLFILWHYPFKTTVSRYVPLQKDKQLTWRRSSSVYFMLKRDGTSEGQGSATGIYKGDLHVRGQIPAYKGWPTREGSGTYPHCTGLTYRTTIGRGHSPKLSRISTSCNCTHNKYIGCRGRRQGYQFSLKRLISWKAKQEETDGHFVGSSPLSWNGKDAEFRYVSYRTVGIWFRETKSMYMFVFRETITDFSRPPILLWMQCDRYNIY